MDLFVASYLLLWSVVIVEGLLLVLILRAVGVFFLGTRDAISREGLRVGQKAPDFAGTTADGRATSLSALQGNWLVLILAAPTCQICAHLLPTLPELRQRLGGQVEFVVLLRSDNDVAIEYERAMSPGIPIIAVGKEGLAERYNVRVSPFVHILDSDRIVRAKGLVNDRSHVEHMLVTAGVEHPALGDHAGHLHLLEAHADAGHR